MVPDIIAVPLSKDLSERLYDQVTCIEVEADPVKYTTFDKLTSTLRRCYRARCSTIKIVVLDEKSKEVVEERLRDAMAMHRSISAGMGIFLEWLNSVKIDIKAYRAEEKGPKKLRLKKLDL